MALAIDELVSKAITTTTNLQAIIPQVWAARVEKNLRKMDIMQQFAVVNTDLETPGAGDTVYIPILPDLGAATLLTEGTDITDIALSNAQSVKLVPAEYGLGVSVTRKALDRIKYDGAAEVVDRLSYSMSLTINGQFAALWNATVPAGPNGGPTPTTLTNLYPNGHASGTIVAGDTLSDVMLLTGVATLETSNNIPWDDGYYRMVITPKQYAQLIQDTNIRQDLRYASPERLLNNEKGALHGIRIVTSNYVVTDTENTITAAHALLMAPRWAAIAFKRRPQVVIDPTVYDYGRRRRFGIVADFDIELVHADRAVVITTANV